MKPRIFNQFHAARGVLVMRSTMTTKLTSASLAPIDNATLDHVTGGAGGRWAQFGLGVANAAIQGAAAGGQQGAQSGRPILGALRGAAQAALGSVAQNFGAAAGLQ